MKEYLTVAAGGRAEFIEKKSRFIGHILPVSTEEEALAFIKSTKSRYWDASHNVYAYVLRNGQTRRYSDDGEPKGTAGVPVLDVLLKEALQDCAVVVTRYFGGTLLGAGGLVRAYAHACKLAVDASGVVKMTPAFCCGLTCDYGYYEKFLKLKEPFGLIINSQSFTEQVSLQFELPQADFEQLNNCVFDTSLGRFSLKIIGESYVKIK